MLSGGAGADELMSEVGFRTRPGAGLGSSVSRPDYAGYRIVQLVHCSVAFDVLEELASELL